MTRNQGAIATLLVFILNWLYIALTYDNWWVGGVLFIFIGVIAYFTDISEKKGASSDERH
jgi:hypothetical protein